MDFIEIKNLLKERSLLHMNDPSIEKYREKLINLLSISARDTIEFLESCNKDEVLLISEVFEEIAYNLQSNDYINCLKIIDMKYPDLNLTNIIEIAKEYME